jgi:isocitrate/isopropylmalate dehydrogenase
VGAIERLLADPAAPRTGDIGGRATTSDVGQAIAALI